MSKSKRFLLFLVFGLLGVLAPGSAAGQSAQRIVFDDPLVPEWHRSELPVDWREQVAQILLPHQEGQRSIVVAFILDTGLDPVEFTEQLLPRPGGGVYGFSARGGADNWASTDAHGNAVAWRLRDRFQAYRAMHGLSPDQVVLKFIPIRIAFRDNGSVVINDSDIVAGLAFMDQVVAGNGLGNGFKFVVNMSFGGFGRFPELEIGIGRAFLAGGLVVAAAGNRPIDVQGSSPAGSAAFVPQLTVGALREAGDEPASWSAFGQLVRTFAPGELVQVGPASFGSGTSLASPDVAALVLVGLALTRTNWDLTQLVTVASDPLPSGWEGKVFPNGGIFNPARALDPSFAGQLAPSVPLEIRKSKIGKVVGRVASDDEGIFALGQTGGKLKFSPSEGEGLAWSFTLKGLDGTPPPRRLVSVPFGGTVLEVKVKGL